MQGDQKPLFKPGNIAKTHKNGIRLSHGAVMWARAAGMPSIGADSCSGIGLDEENYWYKYTPFHI